MNNENIAPEVNFKDMPEWEKEGIGVSIKAATDKFQQFLNRHKDGQIINSQHIRRAPIYYGDYRDISVCYLEMLSALQKEISSEIVRTHKEQPFRKKSSPARTIGDTLDGRLIIRGDQQVPESVKKRQADIDRLTDTTPKATRRPYEKVEFDNLHGDLKTPLSQPERVKGTRDQFEDIPESVAKKINEEARAIEKQFDEEMTLVAGASAALKGDAGPALKEEQVEYRHITTKFDPNMHPTAQLISILIDTLTDKAFISLSPNEKRLCLDYVKGHY